MKICLFLDIDGVLVPFNEDFENQKDEIDENCLFHLTQFIEKFNPTIIVSSDRRIRFSLTALSNFIGIELHGKTGTQNKIKNLEKEREFLILDFVNNHPEFDKFIVIDDLELQFKDKRIKFIKCIDTIGLNREIKI